MIKNIDKNRILDLKKEIPIRDGSVVSANIARLKDAEITLYSFDRNESITTQDSFGDVLYYIISGDAEFTLKDKKALSKEGDALLVPHLNPHAILAKDGTQVLYIQVMKKGEEDMYINNFVQNEVVTLKDQIEYEKGKIVSKSLVQRSNMTLTLFAFDKGEGVSTHASKGDAMVIVLDGEAEITVDGVSRIVKPGDSIVMPATHPHSVMAKTPYKMLLTVILPE